ncbi:hypothetical protein VNI00_002099 [Paramarasmius palmivorus]|uniref:Uncharacterized protein n=1 Tax=Paramarasmius palmivorus TaxID=297713 RepID=A0AAW0E489_9AGAR
MKHCPAYKRPLKTAGSVGDRNHPSATTNTTTVSLVRNNANIPVIESPSGSIDIQSEPSVRNNREDPSSSTPTNAAISQLTLSNTVVTCPPAQPSLTATQSNESPLRPIPSIPDHLIDPQLRQQVAPTLSISRTSDNGLDGASNDYVADSSAFSTPRTFQRDMSMELIDSRRSLLSSSPAPTETSSIGPSNFSPMSTPSRQSRKRPTKADPCFGEVIGVYRGSKLLKVRRTCKPWEEKRRVRKTANGEEEETGVNVSKMFYDRSRSLLTKLEDFAEATGAWVHFSAQHLTATQPFMHFTSTRLRLEGGDMLDTLHEANHNLYSSLMTARRCDTTQLAGQLARANEELIRANQAKKAAQREAQAQVAEATAAKETAERLAAEMRDIMSKHGISLPVTSLAEQ